MATAAPKKRTPAKKASPAAPARTDIYLCPHDQLSPVIDGDGALMMVDCAACGQQWATYAKGRTVTGMTAVEHEARYDPEDLTAAIQEERRENQRREDEPGA